jgi:hypothetical protein
MFKMGLHDSFTYLKHKLWPKEGLGVKLPIWLLTTKNQELLRFICVQVVCHILCKRCWWRLQFCFRPHLDRRSTKEVKGLQSCGSPNFGNLRFQLGNPRTKWHLGAGPMVRHREYYEGEGGGFPQVWAMVSLVSLCLLVVRPCTKSAPTMH